MKEVKNQATLVNILNRYVTSCNGFDIYERSLLLAIAARVNHLHEGKSAWTCWPTVEQLCQDACMKKTKFHSTLASLVDKRLVDYEKGIKGKSNRYKVNLTGLSSILGKELKYADVRKVSTNYEIEDDDFFKDAPF